MKKMTAALAFICLLLGTVSFSAGQDQRDRDKLDLVKEIIKVNYIRVRDAYQVVLPYRSRHGRIQMLQDRNLLIIEDQGEFVDKILQILKEIDIRPVDLQFTVDLILASKKKSSDDSADVKSASDQVIQEIRKMLNYQYFYYMDTSLIKVQDNGYTAQRLAGAIGDFRYTFQLSLRPRVVSDEGEGLFQLELSLRQLMGYKDDGNARLSTLIETALSLKNKERTVVGVSKLNGGDKALILIIRGETLN